jgi:hypothetical protein
MKRLALAVAAAALIPFAASAAEKSHADYLASVSTYKALHGFTHTVGNRHFVGYFVAANDGCAVTVIDATVGDDRLTDGSRRHKLTLAAGGRAEVKAGEGKALGIGCNAEADAIAVVALDNPNMASVTQ